VGFEGGSFVRRILLLSAGSLLAVGSWTGWAALGQPENVSPETSVKPWMNHSLPTERRADLLVRAMTLDEKILEIHMMNTKEHPREVPAIPRLGIPALKITNGPAGAGPGDSPHPAPATALPSALALAASWDPELAEEFGRVAASESADRGERVIEAPGVNITRVPQNGRNFEYFGEDPYLAGQLAAAEIKGIQSQGVIAEVKHFDANNQETNRKTINEVMDERTQREIYLPAFEAAVRRGRAAAVMCAYPSVNGEFGCENTHQLKDILRGEWGFQGFVQSDYTATHSTVAAALAGLDLEMKHDEHYDSGMKTAITSGKLPESAVDTMLVRRFGEMFRFGLFDRPDSSKVIPAKKDGEIARAIAGQCAVLLKNSRGQLPLQPDAIHALALIGPYAGAALTGGGGSSQVVPLYTVTPIEGIKKYLGTNATVTYNDGSDVAAAVAIAKTADLAVLMVGNKDREGQDRPNLSLPDNQDALVSAVAAANPHTVVVLKTGGPVLMPWLDRVPVVFEAWYPGEEDGNVVADVLFGKVNPSGKLPMTFPKAENETPASTPEQYPGVNGTAVYSEGLQVGYRWYDAQKVTPLFPFGFGLSYTKFQFGKLSLPLDVRPGRPVSVALDVKNAGWREGADVVQVYLASPSSAGEPGQQLRGFTKVELKPGETKHVTITLDPRAFSIWDTNAKRWTVVPGNYRILAGDSSRDLPLHGAVALVAGVPGT
jgi:beta-glucosidase